ncbi:hypothetical protein A33M_3349 [Rhodovulum sp. PH10]|nr:hypothetical protein A33M_3349 [Rhodovulum sp. PH10]
MEIRKRQGERLRAARIAAGYRSARDAALSNGWPESSYRAHEGGTRTIGQDDADRYARRFVAAGARVSARDILFGDLDDALTAPAATVPLVGYVGAGAETYFFNGDQGELGRVEAPDGAGPSTVAVEIRGDSLGAFFNNWLVFYDDVRRPITPDLIGRLCIVGLPDDRVLIKKVQRSRTRGLFHLLSQFEPPILDVPVEWAAKVKSMVPK